MAVWLYLDPVSKHFLAACPRERMQLMPVDGHDDYFMVLLHGVGQAEHKPAASAAALAKVAAPPTAPQGAGGLLATMHFVLPALWLP